MSKTVKRNILFR